MAPARPQHALHDRAELADPAPRRLTGTESIFARDDALAIDPYNKASGITEDDIPDVLLSRCTTAREACALLGRIIEEAGCGEGFGVGFVDSKEVWYLETGTGHQWIAHRTPADKYMPRATRAACANTIRNART